MQAAWSKAYYPNCIFQSLYSKLHHPSHPNRQIQTLERKASKLFTGERRLPSELCAHRSIRRVSNRWPLCTISVHTAFSRTTLNAKENRLLNGAHTLVFVRHSPPKHPARRLRETDRIANSLFHTFSAFSSIAHSVLHSVSVNAGSASRHCSPSFTERV